MGTSLEEQKRETFWVFEDIRSAHGVPEVAVVEFHFVPVSEEAEWAQFSAEAASKGFGSERYEDGSTLEITTRPLALSAETIWEHEELLSIMARNFGFEPDGWGFFGVDGEGNLTSN